MTLGLTKSYSPSSGQVANSTSYNTDISALFNALSGLEAQTSTLGALTITPSANSTTILKVTNAAGTEIVSVDTTNSAFKLLATGKLYFDGGGDTYIVESAADILDIYVGALNMIKLTEAATDKVEILGSDLEIDATKKFYLDGGSDTYITESSANRMDFYTGTTLRFRIDNASTSVQIAAGTDLYIPKGQKFYLDGGTDTFIYNTDTYMFFHLEDATNWQILLFSGEGGGLVPKGGGTWNLGDGTNYWNDVSYKTLTDRGCLGWFDEGVELQNGKIVKDTEALLAIKKHATKKTIYGSPMLDYKSFPKVAYKKAASQGKVLDRDENDEPVGGSDGIEMTSMFSIMIGAIKELTLRIKNLEDNNV